MYRTLFGKAGFRAGFDLYFARHDGTAVTCDDFRAAMADANGVADGLAQFEEWYTQAGTPAAALTAAATECVAPPTLYQDTSSRRALRRTIGLRCTPDPLP